MLRRSWRPLYTSSPAAKAARIPRACARSSRAPARCGLVANSTSSGIVIEVTGRPGRRDVRQPLIVPDRTRREVLQPVRPAMPHRLGDRPAVMVVQFHQQAADHLAAALPGLPPGKAPGHLPEQVRQQRGPGIIRYRDSSDCRVLIVSHKPIMIAQPHLRGHASDQQQLSHGHELQLPYQIQGGPTSAMTRKTLPPARSQSRRAKIRDERSPNRGQCR